MKVSALNSALACLLPLSWAQDDTFLLPHGTAAGDTEIPSADDDSTRFDLAAPLTFLSDTFTSWYFNTNGVVSFDRDFANVTFVPGFPSSGSPAMAAIYLDDFDSTSGGSTFGRTTSNVADLVPLSIFIRTCPGGESFFAEQAIVATWHKVNENSFGGSSAVNSVQLVIAYGASGTWVVFDYARLEWYYEGAQRGFNNRGGTSGIELPSISSNEDMDTLLSGSNCGQAGLYAYSVMDDLSPTYSPSQSSAPSLQRSNSPSNSLAPSPQPSVEPTNLPSKTNPLAPTLYPDAFLLPYGVVAGDAEIPSADDGSTRLDLASPLIFLGDTFTSWYFNTNGVVSFDENYTEYTVSSFPVDAGPAMAAIYLDDFDSTAGGSTFGRTTSNAADLAAVSSFIRTCPGGESFVAEHAIVATWDKVKEYGRGSSPEVNSVQLITAYGRGGTWVVFDYARLEWYCEGARRGFNNRGGTSGIDLSKVLSDEDMDTLLSGSNCGQAGLYAYSVFEDISPTVSPSPNSSPTGPLTCESGDEKHCPESDACCSDNGVSYYMHKADKPFDLDGKPLTCATECVSVREIALHETIGWSCGRCPLNW